MPIPRDIEYDGPTGLPKTEAIWGEVRALILTSPHYKGACKDLDGEDLLQEVMLGVFTRQGSRGAFDRRRSSLGRYIRLVTYSVTANQIDKLWRRNKRAVKASGEDWVIMARGSTVTCTNDFGSEHGVPHAKLQQMRQAWEV